MPLDAAFRYPLDPAPPSPEMNASFTLPENGIHPFSHPVARRLFLSIGQSSFSWMSPLERRRSAV
jgi:hypothetical protein